MKDISTISHVYFFSYIFNPDPKEEIKVNVELLERAVTAVENLSQNLKFVALPTGTKVSRGSVQFHEDSLKQR